jgi:hypothetical protein
VEPTAPGDPPLLPPWFAPLWRLSSALVHQSLPAAETGGEPGGTGGSPIASSASTPTPPQSPPLNQGGMLLLSARAGPVSGGAAPLARGLDV